MNIIRKKLTPDEVSPPNLRYNSDCDCIQQTPDGGTTWTDTPGQDPRSADGFRLPPRGGSDPRCDAAANMRANIETQITNVGNAMSTANNSLSGISVIIGIFSFAAELTLLPTLILDFCNYFFGVGVSALQAAFTSTVYDELENIFYCNISADGTVTAAQFTAIQNAVSDHFGALNQVNLALQLQLNFMGAVQLSNAGATGTAVGSCGSFECCPDGLEWCHTLLDDTQNQGGAGFDEIPLGGGWIPDTGAVYLFDSTANRWGWIEAANSRSAGVERDVELHIRQTLPSARYTYLSILWAFFPGTWTTDFRSFNITLGGTNILSQTTSGSDTFVWTGDETGALVLDINMQISYRSDSTNGGGAGRVFETVVGGLGTNPF